MITNYFFKGLDKGEEEIIHDYLPSKLINLEKALVHFAADAAILNVNVERFEKHNAYGIEWILKLPKKTLVAKETSHTLQKAIDKAKEKMLRQIHKHEDTLRKEHTFDREQGSIRSNALIEEAVEDEVFALED